VRQLVQVLRPSPAPADRPHGRSPTACPGASRCERTQAPVDTVDKRPACWLAVHSAPTPVVEPPSHPAALSARAWVPPDVTRGPLALPPPSRCRPLPSVASSSPPAAPGKKLTDFRPPHRLRDRGTRPPSRLLVEVCTLSATRAVCRSSPPSTGGPTESDRGFSRTVPPGPDGSPPPPSKKPFSPSSTEKVVYAAVGFLLSARFPQVWMTLLITPYLSLVISSLVDAEPRPRMAPYRSKGCSFRTSWTARPVEKAPGGRYNGGEFPARCLTTARLRGRHQPDGPQEDRP
jgi:hypothetical protein